MASLLNTIITGIELGSYIAIAAIGFTLVYGLINMLNFAHAEFMTFGAYIGFVMIDMYQLPISVTIIGILVGSGIFGWIIAQIFYEPILDSSPIALLITSIGVGFVLRFGMQLFTGARPRFIPALSGYTVEPLRNLGLTSQAMLVIGTSVLIFAILHLSLTRTRLGIALRAMAAERDLAKVTGIDVDRMRDYVWILSGALGGLGGFMYAQSIYVTPHLGPNNIILVITAAILGGAGSVYGAILGAYVLGLSITLSTAYLLPAWASNLQATMAFLILIGILIVRPGGITGEDVTVKREEI
jgi:branched-subunit amino acid ABC-type transport system permease component